MEDFTLENRAMENSKKLLGKFLIGVIVALVLLAAAGAAGAGTFPVTSGANDGDGSLRRAVQSANAESVPSTIVIDPSVKNIYLSSGSIAIDGDVTLEGAGATIRGSKVSRLFNISAGNVTFNNLTFTDGNAFSGGESGGAAAIDSVAASVTFRNCTFFGNYASGNGGAVYVYGAGSLRTTFINCTLTQNTASFSGGGVAVVGGVVEFIASIATGNSSPTDADIHSSSSAASVSGAYNVVGRTSVSLAGVSENVVSVQASDVFKTPATPSTVDGVLVMELLSATVNPALDKIPHNNPHNLPATDERGAPRPQMSAIDAGAYELSPVALTAIELDGSAYVEVNMSENYTATVTPETATLDVRGYTDGLEWTVSDPRILSVDSKGKVSGLAVGTGTVKVTAHGWDAAGSPIIKEASKTVTVGNVPAAAPTVNVLFTDEKLEMVVGEQYTVHALIEITPTETPYTVTFSSDRQEVASVIQGGVSASSALIKALVPGETVIRVSVTAKNSKGEFTNADLYSLTVTERRSGGGGCNSFAGLAFVLLGLSAFFLKARISGRAKGEVRSLGR